MTGKDSVLWGSCGNWPHSIVMGFVRIDEKMDFLPIMQHTGELIIGVTLDRASFPSDAGTEIAQCKTLANTNLT